MPFVLSVENPETAHILRITKPEEEPGADTYIATVLARGSEVVKQGSYATLWWDRRNRRVVVQTSSLHPSDLGKVVEQIEAHHRRRERLPRAAER